MLYISSGFVEMKNVSYLSYLQSYIVIRLHPGSSQMLNDQLYNGPVKPKEDFTH